MNLHPSETVRQQIGKWTFSHFGLATLLLASISLNALLAWRAIYWRHRVEAAVAAREAPPNDPLASTPMIPVLTGKHIDGSRARVDFANQALPTLLYVLSPSCGWCAKNLANFRALIEQSKDKYKIVAVSVITDGAADYAARNRLAAPQVEFVVGVSESVVEAQELSATPQTLLVSPAGKLIERWRGAYVASTQADIERTLGVRLPGLVE